MMTQENPQQQTQDTDQTDARKLRSPVHSLRQSIETAFSNSVASNTTTNEDCVSVIGRFLKLIDWSQGARRIFEAMPHADTMETLSAFRSVLYRLGFKTSIEKASIEKLRNEYLPCFLRTENGRVVLIEKANDKGSLTIFDPRNKERIEIAPDQVTGVVIFPEVDDQKADQTVPTNVKWSTRVIQAFKPVIVQIFFVSFAINLFALAPPLYVMNVYDKAIGTKSLDVLIGLTVGMAIIVAADFALRRLRVKLQSYLGARLDEQVNEAAFRQLLHMELSYTEDAPIGSQLTRLRQMTSLQEAFTGQLASAVFDLPFVFLFVAVIALIGGHMIWIPVALITGYVVVAAWATPRTNKLVRAAGDAKARLNNLTVEAVAAQSAIKDLCAESIWLKKHRRLSAQAAMAHMKARQFNTLVQTFSQSMVAIAGVAVLAIGTQRVIAGDLSAGALIAIMALAWRVLGPIRNLFLSALTVGHTLQSIEQIDRLVRMPLEREPNSGPSIPRTFKGHVAFEGVTFRYPGQREPSLRSVSFQVHPGNLLCLYGSSGSGTSTVLRVLMGLYQQQAGSVYIDGLDLRQLDKGEWRHSLGVGLQTLDFFHGTIAQNIRLAHPAATDEEIDEIIRHFGVDKYFGNVLDAGVETRYTTLSQSNWPDALRSRINLCRAFVKKAPLYLLDEPALTLDGAGEKALLSLIEERKKTSAIIMTTQRPSHMRIADQVLWMERGAVRDAGTPDQVVPKLLAVQTAAPAAAQA
ncbi:MAG: ABC transporter transmembrane domain-containing protein [Pseudomonadota bacterium]